MLGNRCVLQQQHVDCKIADALLKKSTKQHADGWDASSKDWAHMVLHLPHTEGGFGVYFHGCIVMTMRTSPDVHGCSWVYGDDHEDESRRSSLGNHNS
jgi:hypothetical protein